MKNAEYFQEQASKYRGASAFADAPRTLEEFLDLRVRTSPAPITLKTLFSLSDRPSRVRPATQIRLGTRSSPLALRQANEVRRRLLAAHPGVLEPESVVIVPVSTTGDQVRDRALAEIGGKGLFTRELDEALSDGRIDIAVHSLKDVPTWLPPGQVIAATLPREDARDVLLTAGRCRSGGGGIDDLPQGALIGTCSPRRQAQLLHRRPDLRATLLRGNVGTRLRKLEDGEFDATILALAGLNRLGIVSGGTILEPEDLLPSVAQGIIGVTARSDDSGTRTIMAAIDDPLTHRAATAERAMLDVLDGSCRTPIGGLAIERDGRITLHGLVAMPDGSALHRTTETGPAGDPAALGLAVGRELRRRAGQEFFRDAA